MDVASQTEALDEEEPAKEVTENTLIAEPRRKLPEEIECEKLSRDLASQLGPNDKLVTILGLYLFILELIHFTLTEKLVILLGNFFSWFIKSWIKIFVPLVDNYWDLISDVSLTVTSGSQNCLLTVS